ncbi:alpha/beta hydrolase family protein [Roseomonas sp. CCTCC AB2023176]|uniref:alpha/beta hydrolase family protein n=1 Tax=Roseomonas sp. CCTCC AB2023176 TaxID=3342640 RepID=UPI0035D5BDD6
MVLTGCAAAAQPSTGIVRIQPNSINEARVTEERGVWRDSRRARDIPVLTRAPPGPGPFPAVIVSHGLGGSREGLAYLGRALANAGYVAIHLQHVGTDDSLWRNGGAGLAAGALDVQGALDRLLDTKFALDNLPPSADAQRIAIAGHSYGAWTVQHMLGERLPGGDRGLGLPDPRLKAGIALSPIPARGLPPRLAYGGIVAPVLHVTGTNDGGYIEGVQPRDRRAPFEGSAGPAALAVLDGAVHQSFADEAAAGPRFSDPTYHPRTAALSVTFLDAVLRRDEAALARLRDARTTILSPTDEFVLRGLA